MIPVDCFENSDKIFFLSLLLASFIIFLSFSFFKSPVLAAAPDIPYDSPLLPAFYIFIGVLSHSQIQPFLLIIMYSIFLYLLLYTNIIPYYFYDPPITLYYALFPRLNVVRIFYEATIAFYNNIFLHFFYFSTPVLAAAPDKPPIL